MGTSEPITPPNFLCTAARRPLGLRQGIFVAAARVRTGIRRNSAVGSAGTHLNGAAAQNTAGA